MTHQSNNWQIDFDCRFNPYFKDDTETLDRIKSFIASAVEAAREEGRSHGCEWGFNSGVGEGRRLERREILALIPSEATEDAIQGVKIEYLRKEMYAGNRVIRNIRALITSRESSKGGNCCPKCHGEYTPKYGENTYRCLNAGCECHR